MNDFRKYATKHLGINGMVLDDVISTQAQYLNPYILYPETTWNGVSRLTQLSIFPILPSISYIWKF